MSMMPYLTDPDVTLWNGDALEVLRELPDESVDCACGCGGRVATPDAKGRPRRFLRGHNLRVDHPKDRPGFKPSFLGRKHTPETRAKLSVRASVPKPWIRGDRNGMSGRTGAGNPNWKGGVSPERQRLYASGDWKAIAKWVYARDGYACVRCEARKSGPRSLHVHHLKSWADYPELRFDLDNLVTLCRDCHHDAHRKGG